MKRTGSRSRAVKRVLVWVILFAMPVRSSLARHSTRSASSAQLGENAQVRAATAWFAQNLNWINEEQVRLTEIPAPAFQEGQRSAAVKALLSAAGLNVQIDAAGNVYTAASSAKTLCGCW